MAKPTRHELRSALPQIGRLDWIGASEGNRGTINALETGRLEVGSGLVGDYHHSVTRQVTLIQAEHLPVIGALLGRDPVHPTETRRNLVVSGINLMALKGRVFEIGGAVLKGTDDCEPCHRMEENLGAGGWNAMCAMGGIIADVLEAGDISVGDAVRARPVSTH